MAKNETKAADPDHVDEVLVPVKVNVSEAGLGLRAGEIRGFALSVAEKMVKREHAVFVDATGKETDKPFIKKPEARKAAE